MKQNNSMELLGHSFNNIYLKNDPPRPPRPQVRNLSQISEDVYGNSAFSRLGRIQDKERFLGCLGEEQKYCVLSSGRSICAMFYLFFSFHHLTSTLLKRDMPTSNKALRNASPACEERPPNESINRASGASGRDGRRLDEKQMDVQYADYTHVVHRSPQREDRGPIGNFFTTKKGNPQ